MIKYCKLQPSGIFLFRNLTIRSISAFVMLMIFSLSITPKLYLHDLFARHSDILLSVPDDGKVHITQSGFSCDCNTLVSTSPFTDYAIEIDIKAPLDYSSFPCVFITPEYVSSHSFIELRGPPALG